MNSTLYQVIASLGGAGALATGVRAGLAWLSGQARREQKLDDILANLTAMLADHETRIRALEGAAPK